MSGSDAQRSSLRNGAIPLERLDSPNGYPRSSAAVVWSRPVRRLCRSPSPACGERGGPRVASGRLRESRPGFALLRPRDRYFSTGRRHVSRPMDSPAASLVGPYRRHRRTGADAGLSARDETTRQATIRLPAQENWSPPVIPQRKRAYTSTLVIAGRNGQNPMSDNTDERRRAARRARSVRLVPRRCRLGADAEQCRLHGEARRDAGHRRRKRLRQVADGALGDGVAAEARLPAAPAISFSTATTSPRFPKPVCARCAAARSAWCSRSRCRRSIPVFTVGDQIAETVRTHFPVSQREAKERAVEALASVRIAGPANCATQYPMSLSGGMRQRVMIAMALVCEPKLLIADEPTTALDVTIQAQIMELLLELGQRTGTAILFITHNLGLIAESCERMITMYAGEVVEDGAGRGGAATAAASLYRRPARIPARTARAEIAPVVDPRPRAVAARNARGLPLRRRAAPTSPRHAPRRRICAPSDDAPCALRTRRRPSAGGIGRMSDDDADPRRSRGWRSRSPGAARAKSSRRSTRSISPSARARRSASSAKAARARPRSAARSSA